MCCCRAGCSRSTSRTAPTGTHFYIAIAIVAGFSERWARGVLAGTEERIHGAGAAKPGPSAPAR